MEASGIVCRPTTSVLLSARTEGEIPTCTHTLRAPSHYIMTRRHRFAFTLMYWLRESVGAASGRLSAWEDRPRFAGEVGRERKSRKELSGRGRAAGLLKREEIMGTFDG